MPRMSENNMIEQYRVVKALHENLLWEDYVVEHMFLGTLENLRLFKSSILNLPECTRVVMENLEDMSQIMHPHIISLLNRGNFKGDLFITMQHVEGLPVKEYFNKKKFESVQDFYAFHSRLLEILTFLYQENINIRNLELKDFLFVEESPFMVNFALFNGVERYLSSPEYSAICAFLDSSGGAYAERRSINTKENLRAMAQMMYQTIGWGDLEDALRIKSKEESAPRKRKAEPVHVPLVPGIDPRIENILIRAWVPTAEGGYTGPGELIDDVINLSTDNAQKGIGSSPSITMDHFARAVTGSDIKESPIPEREPDNLPGSRILREQTLLESPVLDMPMEPETAIPIPRNRKAPVKIIKILLGLLALAVSVGALYAAFYFGKELFGKKNNPPIARATTPSNFIQVNTRVKIDGSSSTDSDEDLLSYYWEVVEGNPAAVHISRNRSTEAATTYMTFRERGTYRIQLRVFDKTTFSESTSLIITVY